MSTFDSSIYREFNWASEAPANGRHGVALNKKIVSLITEHTDIRSICDLGCGNGFNAGQLAERGYEVTGVDASPSGITVAKSAYPKAKFVDSIIKAELPQRLGLESFDLILSCDVIEHLYCPSDLVECAFELLKPGGHFLVITPYHGYWKNLALAVTGKMDSHFEVFNDGGHIKFFSTKTLSTLLKRHGFNNLRFYFYGRFPLLWMNMLCLSTKR
jgi:2-polyprenyl-3-methyl-5-hydroxy-6-metoxy-1,4-benzoquinol methylase